jgi:murein DD-endopeptidase MepM/ murein hydrolase activator NlpD
MPVVRPGDPAAAPADAGRLRQAARALESLVLKQLVTSSKAFTGGEGAGSGLRADLFADALADAMVKGGGIGLAKQIERSIGGTAGLAAAPRDGARVGVRDRDHHRDLDLDADHEPALAPPHRPSADPLAGVTVTSPFGPRADPFDGRLTRHAGVDLAGDEGEPVRALKPGIVRRAGERGGYGQAVEIDHGDGLVTLYAHASELLVREGETVTQGQPVARVGHSGRATGDHLHLEVRHRGRPLDPRAALKFYGLRADDLFESGS